MVLRHDKSLRGTGCFLGCVGVPTCVRVGVGVPTCVRGCGCVRVGVGVRVCSVYINFFYCVYVVKGGGEC